MTRGSPHPPAIGAHPLTGKLVSALRRTAGGLTFAAGDIEGFLKQGTELDPSALQVWVRDLSTLAVTLRNDVIAGGAAAQIEQGLIEPLCRVLEDHRSLSASTSRTNAVEQLVSAERRRLDQPVDPAAAPPEKANTVATYLRSRRTRREP